MSIISKLATSLNRRDEIPNIELAEKIADTNNKNAVEELIKTLAEKKLQNDCIKVLYETGERKPKLISPYLNEFIVLLDHKNNRLQWGAMTAIQSITLEKPDLIYKSLPKIIKAAEKGSVITRDNCVNVLIKLCSFRKYAAQIFPLLNEMILKSPINQVPMYAERAIPVINESNKKLFVNTLLVRLADAEKETQRKRIEKLIKKFNA